MLSFCVAAVLGESVKASIGGCAAWWHEVYMLRLVPRTDATTCLQLDAPEDGADGEGGSRGVDAVRLLSAVLADSPSNRQAMLQMAGAHPTCIVLSLFIIRVISDI